MTKTTIQAHERNIAALDALRGLAALLVVLGHARGIILGAQGTPQSGVGWQKIVFLPTSYAKESVAVFFVLSGYLVGGQVLRLVRRDDFTWRAYVARRFSRLYAVLIPALLFTVGIDAIVRNAYPGSAQSVGATHFRASELACNLAFLQDARCQPFGSNNALWSLGYEMWFYILFAAASLAVACAARRMFRVAAVNGVIAIACLLVFGIHLLWLMPAWLLGVVLAEWQHRRSVVTASARRIAASAALLVVVASISTVTSMAEVPSFILVGVAALPLINAMTSPAPIWSTWPVIQMARLGGWSYTLYAFHRPLVALVAAGLASRSAPLTGVTAVVVIYAVAVLIAALCYAAYFAGEAHTVRIRRALLGASATPARQADPLPATN